VRPRVLIFWYETILSIWCANGSIVHSGDRIVSSLEAQAAKWAHMPIPSKSRHYARTLGLSSWVLNRLLHDICACSWSIFNYQGVCCVAYIYGDLQLASLYVVSAYRFRVAEAWRDEEKGTDWMTWGLDCVPGLRSAADVGYRAARNAPGLCCSAFQPAPFSEVRCKSSPTGLSL